MTTYLGSVRLPYTSGSPDNFSGARAIAIDQTSGQVFMATRTGRVVPLTLPAPVPSSVLNELPIAVAGQGFTAAVNYPPNTALAGMLFDGPTSLISASFYYDANNTQRLGHFYENTWRSLWQADKQGFVAGYLCHVPARWRDELGDFITGQGSIPIITRTSYGPAAFGVRYADFSHPGIVPVKPLVYYDSAHQTLGFYDTATGPLYNQTMDIAGCYIQGDELIFAGTIGIGTDLCYGVGTHDVSKHNQTINGTHYCYDPEPGRAAKGQHAYPYQYQLWKYAIPDLLNAEHPWDCIPTIERLPNLLPGITQLNGAAAHGNTLWLSQASAENTQRVSGYPILHAFDITPVLTLDDRVARLERAVFPDER